jgi:hypothetical protein
MNPIVQAPSELFKSSRTDFWIFSKLIARFSQFFDNSRQDAFSSSVLAITANSAQRAACMRHSLGSPGTINLLQKCIVHSDWTSGKVAKNTLTGHDGYQFELFMDAFFLSDKRRIA